MGEFEKQNSLTNAKKKLISYRTFRNNYNVTKLGSYSYIFDNPRQCRDTVATFI